jgi:hypothetical protein
MDAESLTKAQVIDLLTYKRRRQDGRLDFGSPVRPSPIQAPVSPFRPLTARQVAHRQRMARFLGQANGGRLG